MLIHRHPDPAAARALLAACGLPIEDLEPAHFANFFCAGTPTDPRAVVGVEFVGAAALLRSLAVAADARGRDVGARLLAQAEAHAAAHRARVVYLLTETAADWFAARGYAAVERAAAPAALRATRQFMSLCPASAVLMAKRLDG